MARIVFLNDQKNYVKETCATFLLTLITYNFQINPDFLDEILKNCSLWEVPTVAWWLLLFAVTRHNASKGLPPSTSSFKRPFFLAFEHATLDHRRHLKTMSWKNFWKYIALCIIYIFYTPLDIFSIFTLSSYSRISYSNGWNTTEALIFENLKPVEITKKLFQHHLNILKNV